MVVIGQRVQIGDYGAIVKYLGEVSGTKGILTATTEPSRGDRYDFYCIVIPLINHRILFLQQLKIHTLRVCNRLA